MQLPFDINNTSFVIARLDKGETVKAFDCGDSDLNDFILNESILYRDAKLAVTYVLEDEADTQHERIAAFLAFPMTVFPYRISTRKPDTIVSADASTIISGSKVILL